MVDSMPGYGEHWGCTPVNAFPTAAEPPVDTHNFFVKFPPKMQRLSPDDPVRVCPTPFFCDEKLADETGGTPSFTTSANPAADTDQCLPVNYDNDAGWANTTEPCAPWHEAYGFYTGATLPDLVSPDINNYNAELMMRAVDYDKCYKAASTGPKRPTSCNDPGFGNQAVGDFITLEGELSVEYWYNDPGSDPYLAYFTGGDRLYGCAYAQQNAGDFPGFDAAGACPDTVNEYGLSQSNGLLRNNAEGRYRLEATVFLIKGSTNRSPVIMMAPIVVLRSQAQGTPISFQIPAYDPDENDSVEFRMGNYMEYGAVVRSKLDAFPYDEIYNRLDAINQTAPGTLGFEGYDTDASSPNRGMMKPYIRTDTIAQPALRQLGNFGCNFHDVTVLESGACSSDRVAAAPLGATVSVNGMVEWHAWASSSGVCENAGDASCERLPTGLYNFVVMAEEAGAAGNGKIKVPVDFLVYLYDGSVSFCGDGCEKAPSAVGGPLTPPVPNAGLPTFVDRDGLYGSEISGANPVSRTCTICGADGATQTCNAVDPNLQPQTCTCSVNTPPRFYQSPTKEHHNIPETPMLGEWLTYAADGGEMPYLTYYKGETIEFYVSAYDEDDCAEIYIDSTALPFGDDAQSTLSELIYEEEYPEDIPVMAPQGAFARKKFMWPSNLVTGQAFEEDSRPDISVACFTASDKYLYHTVPGAAPGTMKPYCVEIRLVAPPAQTEQSLFRFEWDPAGDCSSPKLALTWHPELLRYGFVDQGVRYYTECKFEQHMWHHVFATISEDRVARVYVDGELQKLLKEVGQDLAQEATYDKGIPVPDGDGTEVTVIAYANKCKTAAPPAPYWWTCGTGSLPLCPGTVHERANRRRLSSIYDDRELDGTFNIRSDYPVGDGFLFDLNTTLGYVEEPGLAAPSGDCCGFSMGLQCTGEFNSFDGFLDEVVVYNRQVDAEDIKAIMFKMPQYLPTRELEAPRGVQLDLSAGRVLWTRFNNPCMEGPIPEGTTLVGEAATGGRRLQQITKKADTTYGLLSTDAAGNAGRRLGVSDKAGMSSGGAYIGGDGKTYLKLTDTDGDRTGFIKFRDSARYAYTGVPWLAPTISRVEVDRSLISTANPLPLDGGMEVTMSGVGFARSPWLKCVSAQPDVRAKYEAEVLASADKYEARTETDGDVYDNFFRSMSRREVMIESKPWMYEDMDGILLEKADTLLEPNEYSPYLIPTSKKHPQNKGPTAYDPQCTVPNSFPVERCTMNEEFGWENAPSCAFCPVEGSVRLDWHPSAVRNPKTPPYEKMPQRLDLSFTPATAKYEYTLWDDFIYGGWEKVICSAPAAAFPSDHYYLGVSNDGGLTGSPATADDAETVTFTEYALEVDGSEHVVIQSDQARGRTFSVWFMPKDVTGYQNLLNITGGVGIAMQDAGLYVFSSEGQTEYPKDGEAAAEVTVGEWHHAAIVLSGTSGSTLKFYLDGKEVLTDGTVVVGSANPGLTAVGDGFIGYIDEVKVIESARSAEEMYATMWSRESDPSSLALYLRFNAPTQTIVEGQQLGLRDSGANAFRVGCTAATCSFLPVPAPWEPVSLYEINEMGPSVFSYPMTGGDQLEVKGFNFAPSPWTKCGWSRDLVEVFSRSYDVVPDISGADTCPYGIGELNSVMGKPERLEPYTVYEFNNATTAFTNATLTGFSSWADDYEKTMMLQCETPMTEPDVYHMSVSGQKFLNVFPFEITDVSLYCNGKDVYLTAPPEDTSSPISASTMGYTFSAWVMPFDGPEVSSENTRDVASDKLGHRREYLPMEKPEQTIFALENPAGSDIKHAGVVMYDGVRFIYYDDCILDVTSTLDAGSRPNEWHYVAVRIDEEGEGDLFVDGIMVEHFTTMCKPQADASLSLCMDLDMNGKPSAFFHGLVDEVKIVNQKLEDADLLKYMFNQKAHAELSRNLAYYSFDSCTSVNDTSVVASAELTNQFGVPTQVGPNLTLPSTACANGTMLVSSSGPWNKARILKQDKSEAGVSGAHTIRVVGANLGVSQWLGVTFNDTFYPAMEMDGPNVIVVETPPVDGKTVMVEKLANWAGAASLTSDLPAVSTDDTIEVSFMGTVQDLGTGLEAYYTFDAAPTSAPVELGGGVTIPDADALFDFAGHKRNGAVETGMKVPDRDGYENGAVLIADVSVAYLPAPATYMDNTVYTVSVWMLLDFSDDQSSMSLPKPFAPLYGAWKMYSMVRKESGEFDIYINTEPTSDETIRETFQQAIDGFLETGIVMFGLPSSAAVDDMWIYSRALSPTEIIARYYTNAVAVDFSKPAMSVGFGAPSGDSMPAMMSPMSPSADPLALDVLLGLNGPGMSMMAKMMNMAGDGMAQEMDMAPVQITNLDVPEKPTFTAWVYPWESEEGLSMIFADSEGLWSLGIWDQRLSFFVYTDCPCEPCNQMREVISWKARVLPGRWTHIAAKYDTDEIPDVDGEVITLYIDGVLIDKAVFTEYGSQPIMSSGTASVGSDIDGSMRFNGLIYSVGVHDKFVPWQIKSEVQCPQREPEDFVLYMGGSKAAAFGNRTVTVMGVAPEATDAVLQGQVPVTQYANATYDDITVAEAVTITGSDANSKFGGYDGDYIITARTTCSKKRVHGGDEFLVTMTKFEETLPYVMPGADEVFDTSSLVAVTDGSDGNYHVSYTGLQCGIYETDIKLADGSNVTTFNTTIMPNPTDPTTSVLLTQQSGSCLGPFGVVHTLQIVARDFAGCDQTDGTDVIMVSIRGPADITVPAVHVSGGLYEAKFVPPAAGKYFVEIKLTNAQFVDPVDFTTTPYLCIDICDGHSINFDGTGSVETSPVLTDYMDSVQDTGAITMEAWVSPTSATVADGYILFKGTVAEADDDDSVQAPEYSKIKGYSLRVSSDLRNLIGTVYLGLGEYLVLEMQLDFQANVWAHVAVTYDGMMMKGYKNGQLIGETAPSAEARPMHHNLYGHPLNVGYRFNGKIDEATVWTRALLAEEVAAKQWCPKYLDMEDVVVYLPFNDDPSSTDMAAFVGPTMSASSPFMPFAAPAVVPSTPGGFVLEAGTPLEGATQGVGVPGSAYSIITPGDDIVAGVFESVVLNLQAFDQCGFHYIGQGEGDFKLELTQYRLQWYTELDPKADGVPMYPINITESPLPIVDAHSLAGTCYASNPAPPYYRGDLYDMVSQAVFAGTYLAKVTTKADAVLEDEIPVEVVARAGGQTDIIHTPVPDTEAGVETAVRFHLNDGFENTILDDHTDDITVSVYQTETGIVIDSVSTPYFDGKSGEYLVSFMAGSPVEHTIDITVTPINTTTSFTVQKAMPTWRKLLTANEEVPSGVRRFESAGVADSATGDMYVWGGAANDKSYLNDVWALRGVDPTAANAEDPTTVLSYRKVVTVSAAKAVESPVVVEVTINTLELVESGKMHHKCNDIYFTMPGNGNDLKYYVDTFADHTCGTEETTVYLLIPAGILTEDGSSVDVEMYYGAPGHYWPNPNSDPAGVFAFYEGFESGTMGALKPVEPCTQEEAEDDGGFVVEEFEEAYSGNYALHATKGARAVLMAAAEATLDSFVMRAWFWDSNAHEAAHFMSPDYGTCGATAGMDTLLPEGGPLEARSTAVGVYTLSHTSKYCVSSPWQSSGGSDLRSALWHRLEITSTPENGLVVSVDGMVVKTYSEPITYDKVLLATGFSADAIGHDVLANAHAYWDEIMVNELHMCGESVCVSASAPGPELGVVKYAANIGWEKVEVAGSSAPPSRYGHTAASYNGGMLIFGGERSSYAFNDVWWFSFADGAWTYLAPNGPAAPMPRFDHAAAVHDGALYVVGGRSATGEALSDIWMFDLSTQIWTERAAASAFGSRFGHGAAFGPTGEYLYVFGGFSTAEDSPGFLNSFFRCSGVAEDIECIDITAGCPDPAVDTAATVSGVGLTPRSGHTMLPTATGAVVFGGSDASDAEPEGVYTFAESTCSWSQSSAGAEVTRHDHVAVKMTAWMAVTSGVSEGDFVDSVYIISTQ